MSSEEEIDGWTNLQTINTFDMFDSISPSTASRNAVNEHGGYSTNSKRFESSTKLVDKTASVQNDFIESHAAKATAPVSLLVESLVQQLCAMIDPDPARSEQLYSTICKQLHRMNLIDETYLMGEFDVMRSQYQRALYQLATVARGQPEIPINLQSVWPLTDSVGMSWSRYRREFDELNFIAGGGFGRVYRARHKLDGIDYAVKKVTIKYQTINRVLSHLAEVKTFASLNHTNIVPYKAAWLEPLFDSASNRPSVMGPKQNRRRTKSKKKSNIISISNKKINRVEVAVFDLNAKLSTVEFDDEDDNDADSDSETDSYDSDDTSDKRHSDHKNQLKLPTNHNDDSSDFIQFQQNTFDDVVDGANMSSHTPEPNTQKSKRSNKALCKRSALANNNEQNNNNCIKSELEFNESQPHLKLKWATLYIQMSFRPLTLRAWLDERNKHSDFDEFYKNFMIKSVEQHSEQIIGEDDAINRNASTSAVNSIGERSFRRRQSITRAAFEENLAKTWSLTDVAVDIFTQVLNGLNYIHSQNIVHHDIKPSNIFVGCEKNGVLYVQLGDFGLACPLQAKHSPDAMIGTFTYAAPEQLAGHCDPKSDLFSLGIILLELLIPFTTDMERLRTIGAARKGNLPRDLPPKLNELLKRLLQHHKQRPDTLQVFDLLTKLDSNVTSNGEKRCTEIKNDTQSSNKHSELQKQLNDVTDGLNMLKRQMPSLSNELSGRATEANPNASIPENPASCHYPICTASLQSVITSTNIQISIDTNNAEFDHAELSSEKLQALCQQQKGFVADSDAAMEELETKGTETDALNISEISDKDELIAALQGKLMEMSKENKRLRDILDQRNLEPSEASEPSPNKTSAK